MNGLVNFLLLPSSLSPRRLAIKEWVAPESISVNKMRLETRSWPNIGIWTSMGCRLCFLSWRALEIARYMAFYPKVVAVAGGPKAAFSRVSIMALRLVRRNQCHSILGIFLTGRPSLSHISCFRLLMSPLTTTSFVFILISRSCVIITVIWYLVNKSVVLTKAPWTECTLSSFPITIWLCIFI